jgi:hypothetical protein
MRFVLPLFVTMLVAGCGSSTNKDESPNDVTTTTIQPNSEIEWQLKTKYRPLEIKMNESPELKEAIEEAMSAAIRKLHSSDNFGDFMAFFDRYTKDLAARFPGASKEIIDAVRLYRRELVRRFDPLKDPRAGPFVYKMQRSKTLESDFNGFVRIVGNMLDKFSDDGGSVIAAVEEGRKRLVAKYPEDETEINLGFEVFEEYCKACIAWFVSE